MKGFQEAHPNEPTSSGFCGIILAKSDRIFVHRAPTEVIDVVRGAIAAEWPKGVQIDKSNSQALGIHEFKLKGTPWLTLSSETASRARKLALYMITKLRRVNWILVEDLDLNRANFTQLWVLRKVMEALPEQMDLMVSLHDTDDIRLFTADNFSFSQMQSVVRHGIEPSWPIKAEKEFYGGFEFKLKGRPWYAQAEDAVHSRQILLGICTEMDKSIGFQLVHTVNVSAKNGSKSCLVFRKRVNDDGSDQKIDGEYRYSGLSLNHGDMLRLLDVPGVEHDRTLIDALTATIEKSWPRGIKAQKDYGGSHQWKLNGWPWKASGTDTVDARRLVSFILQTVWIEGFELMPGVDCSGKLGDSSLIVFRRKTVRERAPAQMYPSLDGRILPVACVSFHDTNDVRISCTSTEIATGLVSRLRASLTSPDLFCDVVKKECEYGESYQFILQAHPFTAFPGIKSSTYIGSIVLSLVDTMTREGWAFRASLDVSQKYVQTKDTQYKLDLGSMFFTPTNQK